VNALVTAGRCRNHGTQRATTTIYGSQFGQKRSTLLCTNHHFLIQRFHSTAVPKRKTTEPITKKELLDLVDQYGGESLTEQFPSQDLPKSRESIERVAEWQKFVVSELPINSEWPSKAYTWPAQGEHGKAVARLIELLDEDCDNPEELYQLYKTIPTPRIPYLEANYRHKLLVKLGVLEHKDEHSMWRYLYVIDDMKLCQVPLRVSEWNIVMSFVGRYVPKTTEVEAEAGLRVFKEMEHVAGKKGNAATFNILFDMATKAGKFKLGEMIYEEMGKRGLQFNRFHYVSLIHCRGLERDGQGVRRAYKDLIEAGEIVDTIVLNCMISSLITAGEPQAAEQVYERMKKMHIKKTGAKLPPRDWRSRRQVNNALLHMAKLGKKDPALLEAFRKDAIMAPDIQTYRLLIQYTTVHAGDLQRASQLLDEMKMFEVPLDGAIFLSLFKGFFVHGGVRYSHWMENRFTSVWKAYMEAIESGTDGVHLGKWIIIWALRASMKVAGQKKMFEIWDEVKDKWEPRQEELAHVTEIIRELTQS
jgi:pentatricopeptide repeat protein